MNFCLGQFLPEQKCSVLIFFVLFTLEMGTAGGSLIALLSDDHRIAWKLERRVRDKSFRKNWHSNLHLAL